MQAPPTSQRSMQRRSPAADPGPPPTMPARSISPGPGAQPRTSSSAAKNLPNGSGSGRRPNPNTPPQNSNSPQLSQIEKSVTHLLVATKQLLETLTQWSRHQATDAQVSDVYVRLGYEFNIACRAFTAINVDTSDLGNVPELLRHILESTLSQEASVESLEKYLPRIRDIIITLLHGLKRKQQKLRQKQSREGSGQIGEAPLPRATSISSVGSAQTGLTTLLDQGISNQFQGDGTSMSRDSTVNETNAPPRMSSQPARRGLPTRDQSRGSVASDQSTLSSNKMQNMPVLPPYPGDDATGTPGEPNVDAFPPPPPPKSTQNALAALQRGGDLERRASRRYSAYQISKHLNASANGLPMMPPVQNSPIPNRGRDVRESMNAIQKRDPRHARNSSTRLQTDISPARVPSRVSEDPVKPTIAPPKEPPPEDSPISKTPEDKLRQSVIDFDDSGPSATLQGPPTDEFPYITSPDTPTGPAAAQPQEATVVEKEASYPQERQFTPEHSPPPGKELTIFLQYKTKVKKFVLTDGYNELSIARLQLAFIEKFAWNTHNNGVELPEIYIQDPVSGVRHELEDLQDVKDRSVLVLNVEVLDEVKRHIDEGLVGIREIVQGVRTAVDDQQVSIQQVSDRQQDTAKEMARLASAPISPSRGSTSDRNRANASLMSPSKVRAPGAVSELQNLRRDFAVLRQTYSGFQSDIQNSMSTIRTKANSVKAVALDAAIPSVDGESGRYYVNSGKKNLTQDSDTLLARVDDVQDTVEELRKDVVVRGVRPLPRQLETVAKDISQSTMGLKKLQDFLKRERPIWTKIWEKELETVCQDREELTMQEDLAADLQDDLEKATQTFALVEQATKEQTKDATPGAINPRILSKGLNHVSAADPAAAKEGVLDEVRALQPNHENRLEAIERAEKLRQKELESRRGGEFQKELGNFVEEGRLKKSGGFEEVERARKARDEKTRREVWERQNGMTQADAMASAVDEPLAFGEEVPTEGEPI
ncbi:actin interacting protein 3-domain-containing protein [Amylocarpus encephaloides]|uniref:Actin interacting protein 3-domain-containing protein n=1 Tax=Amylocarpus encephaloides TaxID=45428 RepID=A0A9P8C707_9HELO|nr:actin interacting protein 3-domain-containing protein [Amylocarpus encephaloides]